MTTNVAIFALATFFETAGCCAFWMWLRRGAIPLMAVLGVARLITFASALTRVDSAFAGRAYAAYGGIYVRVCPTRCSTAPSSARLVEALNRIHNLFRRST